MCVVCVVSTLLSTEQLDIGQGYFVSPGVTTLDFLTWDIMDLLVCTRSSNCAFLVKYFCHTNLILQMDCSLIGQHAALSVTLCCGAVFSKYLDSPMVPFEFLELSSDVITYSIQ